MLQAMSRECPGRGEEGMVYVYMIVSVDMNHNQAMETITYKSSAKYLNKAVGKVSPIYPCSSYVSSFDPLVNRVLSSNRGSFTSMVTSGRPFPHRMPHSASPGNNQVQFLFRKGTINLPSEVYARCKAPPRRTCVLPFVAVHSGRIISPLGLKHWSAR